MAWVERRGTHPEKYRGVYRHPVTGKKVSKTFDYESEAEGWAILHEDEANAMVAEARARHTAEAPRQAPTAPHAAPEAATGTTTPPEAPEASVVAYGQAWVDRIQGGLATATASGYRTHLRSMGATGIGALSVGAVTKADVENWITQQANAGTSAGTINARVKVLGMVMRDAMDNGMAHGDPTHRARRPKAEIRKDRVLSADEIVLVLKAAKASPDRRLYPMVLLALYCGLRWQEVAGLTGYAVQGRRVEVYQVAERSTAKIRQGTKSGKPRGVTMPDFVAEVIEPLAAMAGPGLLFPNRVGTVTDYHRWLRGAWRPMVEASGVAPFRFHDLRHTYGTALALAGRPRAEIARFMGHADERTTGRYIHSHDTDADRATVDSVFSPPGLP